MNSPEVSDVNRLAKIIWDYMLMHHELKPMDAIFALCSNDIRVAARAAELYHQGYSPLIIFAGGNGKDSWFSRPEAEVFADEAIERGVPKKKVIIENKSANTGENIQFVKKLLEDKSLNFHSFLLVQKPYMERRTYATFRKQWPEKECIVTSPQITFEEYGATDDINQPWISTVVGDLLRIREYPKQGFQIEQEIPDEVWGAGQELLKLGFNKYAL